MLKFSQIVHYYLWFFIVQKTIAMIIDIEHRITETMTESYKVFSILLHLWLIGQKWRKSWWIILSNFIGFIIVLIYLCHHLKNYQIKNNHKLVQKCNKSGLGKYWVHIYQILLVKNNIIVLSNHICIAIYLYMCTSIYTSISILRSMHMSQSEPSKG